MIVSLFFPPPVYSSITMMVQRERLDVSICFRYRVAAQKTGPRDFFSDWILVYWARSVG